MANRGEIACRIVRSPVAGTVVRVECEPGEIVAPGSLLVAVAPSAPGMSG